MRTIARFMDARNTVEGKFLSVLLSVLLVFSFLNVTMFTDYAGAAEDGEDSATSETSQLKDQLSDKDAEADEKTTESGQQESEPEDSQESDADEESDAAGELASGKEDGGDGAEGQPAVAVLSLETTDDAGDSGSTDASEGGTGNPTVSAAWDAETGTLTIRNIDSLDQTAALNYVKELGTKSADVKALVIASVKEIAPYAFHQSLWTSLETVEIEGVETIGDHAFAGLPKLKAVTLRNIGSIGTDPEASLKGNSFAECRAVTKISMENVGLVGAETFRQCNALTSLEMKGVEAFGRSAFSFCTSLKSVVLDGASTEVGGGGIGSLGKTMFYGCTDLESVELKNFESIPIQMFSKCSALKSAELSHIGTIGYRIFDDCNSLAAVSIKDVDTVDTQAFAQRASMETLAMERVAHVGKNAFWNCSGLKSIVLNEVTIDQNDLRNESNSYNPPFTGAGAPGMTLSVSNSALGGYSFYNCTGLTTADINGVDTIGQYAFSSCSNLQSASLANVAVIDNYAFWYCRNLEAINGLGSVSDRIGGFAFYGCEKLTGLTIADATKMGYVGSDDEIMRRVQAILAGRFQLDGAEDIATLDLEDGWEAGAVDRSDNWDSYDNGTQIMEQARWQDAVAGAAEVKVDAYYTGEKQMDYIFVADLSASMAQLGNPEDSNARFYDMQSKLLDMTGKLLNTPGYDCQVAIVTFGGFYNGKETAKSLDFTDDVSAVEGHIKSLAPLNENTDYGLGLRAALELVQSHSGRNTSLVFLSDGYPTTNGTGGDAYGTQAAPSIKKAGVPIYGVLHSPYASSRDTALKAMEGICDSVYESTDTDTFGQAMNKAFAAAYGKNTVTIPVNGNDFDVSNLQASSGEATYDPETRTISWTLDGMPFTKHSLTYTASLKEDRLDQVGIHSYNINNGNARFDVDGGASAGLELTLSRTVEAPVVYGTYRVTHAYYTNGVLDGTTSQELRGVVGTQVRASDVTPVAVYSGATYVPAANGGSITVADSAVNELVLRYDRTMTVEPTNPANPANPTNPTVPTTPTTPTVPTLPVVPTTPTVTPAATTPAATPAATPTVVTTAAPAPAAAPAAATPAPAAEPIEDDATPQAAAPAERTPLAETEEIEDEATPMGAFDEPHCWVHWVMLLGILITAAYGLVVVRRRLHLADDVDDYEKQVLGIEDEAPEAVPADGRQAL